MVADRREVAAAKFLIVAASCVILLCFSAKTSKLRCNGGGVRVTNGALTGQVLGFGTIHSPVLFPLLTSRSGFGAANPTICGACVRNSIAFCNSLFADRRGVAASKFLVVAAACVTSCVSQLKIKNCILMVAWELRMLLWHQNFSIFALFFFEKKLSQSAFKLSFLASRSVLLQTSTVDI